MTSNEKAFLDTIAWSEGSVQIPDSDDGYRALVGGTTFENYADHPRIKVDLGNGLISTAAGRYQILERTFDTYKKALNLPDFSPASQDAIAMHIITTLGASDALDNGNLAGAVFAVRKIWASLPGSPYGQPRHSLADLQKVYADASDSRDNTASA